MNNHLVCPIQIWVSCDIINELPKFLEENPNEDKYAVVVDDPLDPSEPLMIPHMLEGIKSYFPVMNPIVR